MFPLERFVIFNTTTNAPAPLFIFDGPGLLSDQLKLSKAIYNCKTFQYTIAALQVQNTSFSIQFSSGTLSLKTFSLSSIDSSLNLPATKFCQNIRCHLKLKTNQRATEIKLVVTKISLTGVKRDNCKYAGVTTAEVLNNAYKENVVLCDNHHPHNTARSFYSSNSSLFVVLYWYQEYSFINATLSLEKTPCKSVEICLCTLHQKCSENPRASECEAYLSEVKKDVDFFSLQSNLEFAISGNNCMTMQLRVNSICMPESIKKPTYSKFLSFLHIFQPLYQATRDHQAQTIKMAVKGSFILKTYCSDQEINYRKEKEIDAFLSSSNLDISQMVSYLDFLEDAGEDDGDAYESFAFNSLSGMGQVTSGQTDFSFADDLDIEMPREKLTIGIAVSLLSQTWMDFYIKSSVVDYLPSEVSSAGVFCKQVKLASFPTVWSKKSGYYTDRIGYMNSKITQSYAVGFKSNVKLAFTESLALATVGCWKMCPKSARKYAVESAILLSLNQFSFVGVQHTSLQRVVLKNTILKAGAHLFAAKVVDDKHFEQMQNLKAFQCYIQFQKWFCLNFTNRNQHRDRYFILLEKKIIFKKRYTTAYRPLSNNHLISWSQAHHLCISTGAFLPSFSSRKQMEEFLSFIKQGANLPPVEAVFIGLHRNVSVSSPSMSPACLVQ